MKTPCLEEKLDELLLQLLFAFDQMTLCAKLDKEAEEKKCTVPLLANTLKMSRKKVHDGLEMANKIFSAIQEIDKGIVECSEDYDIERITKVDLAILRMAFYDILHTKECDIKKITLRSFRLAKKFSTDPVCPFLQAVIQAFHNKQMVCAV